MKLVLISDTHTMHRNLELPKGDILIHAGDFTGRGKLEEVESFFNWLKEKSNKYKHIIFIAGNHDMCFEYKLTWLQDWLSKLPTNVHYLEDSEVVIDGIKFYGSPWQPEFHNWAFNLPRGKRLADKWSLIPADTDVLITHGPPLYILDYTFRDLINVGCKDLYEKVISIKPKLHVFGHIHEGYGYKEHNDIMFINASSCTLNYYPDNAPVEIYYTPEGTIEF